MIKISKQKGNLTDFIKDMTDKANLILNEIINDP